MCWSQTLNFRKHSTYYRVSRIQLNSHVILTPVAIISPAQLASVPLKSPPHAAAETQISATKSRVFWGVSKRMKLLQTLVLRPLARDPLRTCLTILAVALGVAVVIGIDLAGNAAAGSFQSSLTTLLGTTDLQISANGSLDETLITKLTQLPIDARFSPVLEAQLLTSTGVSIDLFGVDLIAAAQETSQPAGTATPDALSLSTALARRLHLTSGTRLTLRLPTGPQTFRVSRLIDSKDSEFAILDIATAQQILNRYGKLDRIDVFLAPRQDFSTAAKAIRAALPTAVLVDTPGTRASENQRMLRAFRWNLRVLSYISLVVGAFLIYNTISISVVRRRPEIGILRAIGAARVHIFFLFLAEALLVGIAGSALGVALGRAMAEGLVGLIAQTVNALYTSSRPAAIHLTLASAAIAALTGLAIALLSALGPALEAMRVAPTEAMSRGSRETKFRLHTRRDLLLAAALRRPLLSRHPPAPRRRSSRLRLSFRPALHRSRRLRRSVARHRHRRPHAPQPAPPLRSRRSPRRTQSHRLARPHFHRRHRARHRHRHDVERRHHGRQLP